MKQYIYLKKKKTKKASKLQHNMIYSPLEKCIWRFNLPKMDNSKYIILYGIRLFNTKINLDQLKNVIVNESLDLWDDWNFVQKKGKITLNKARNIKEFNGIKDVCNMYAIIIPKISILDTMDNSVIEYIKKQGIEKEEQLLKRICINKNFGSYKYPPKTTPISKNSRLLEVLEPSLYRIINTKCILDGAIGETDIKNMICKYNNQHFNTKQKEVDAKKYNQQVKDSNTVNKSGQLFSDEKVNKTFERMTKPLDKVINKIEKK